MALSVKAYLNPDTNHQEIRRFAIDEGASASYAYLAKKIEQVFPIVRGKIFKLFWKDADNELITFSSDEELVEALGSISGDVFRVYVKVDESSSQDATFAADDSASSDQNGPAHPGVVCDGCDKHIFGIRFKCVVCPNYDLCLTCETKGIHKEHEMLRIATPKEPGYNFFHSFNPFAFHPPHQPPHVPPHVPPQHPPHGPPPYHPMFTDFGRGFGPWGRGFGRRGGRRSGRGKPRCNNGENKCDRHATESGETRSNDVPVGPPFLHAVGETIASFLGPLGVEVHTYASSEPDCCQGRCNDGFGGENHESTQAGPSGEGTGTPVNDKKDDTTSETAPANDEFTEMEVQAPEEFVLVEEEKEDEPQASEASGSVYDEVDPTNPLEVAIAKMRVMGFEDDSGWLSHLIKAKGYDLNKVLDAMQFEGKN